MVEQSAKHIHKSALFTDRFNWSENAHEEGEEIVENHGLFYLIARPIRLSKPGRVLWSEDPPSDPELRSYFSEIHNYGEEVEPARSSGMHYHHKKVELFFPQGPLELFLAKIENDQISDDNLDGKVKISVQKRSFNTRFGILILPGIWHAFRNPSFDHPVDYRIVSNINESDAIKNGDIIHFEYDLTKFSGLSNPFI